MTRDGRSPAPPDWFHGRRTYRWVCDCQRPPVLLGTYDDGGRVNIKVRDRYWHIRGSVWTICPRCGGEHYLDPETLRSQMEIPSES